MWGMARREKYSGELLKGSMDCLLLALIGREPMYGYQLIREVERQSRGYLQFKEGTLYPALHRLEQDGFIQGRWERLPNGQERRYYSLTEEGEKALQAKARTWKSFAAAVNMVLRG